MRYNGSNVPGDGFSLPACIILACADQFQHEKNARVRSSSNVTLVDRGVGDILHALDASGQADNTIIVYTSEHGDMMGDHGLFEKSVMYEESARVPLLIRVPWLGKEQRFVTGAISQIDLVPTLLDLLGEPIPDGLDGISRAGVLRGEETLAGNDVFIEWNGPDARPIHLYPNGVPAEEWIRVEGPWRTIVSDGRWKLNLSATDKCELYDLHTDPHELVNLYDEPAQAERVRDLKARIGAWQMHVGDQVKL